MKVLVTQSECEMKWREKEVRIVEGVAAWELEFVPRSFTLRLPVWFGSTTLLRCLSELGLWMQLSAEFCVRRSVWRGLERTRRVQFKVELQMECNPWFFIIAEGVQKVWATIFFPLSWGYLFVGWRFVVLRNPDQFYPGVKVVIIWLHFGRDTWPRLCLKIGNLWVGGIM